ncbi:hypothetical protein DM819_21795 [Pseudomonas hunanensis]|uniref:DUF3775 domain-containing protein n=1 Tax=Pseudomonas hunanensis TaxID=1247546 RepID=A0ABD6N3J7_9PSED|nr:DUF3775 domain-containing protein [Pseudomonas hunanensis]NWL48426.1 hypothetical protein [Pseudomonas hunanensis]
MSYVLKHLSAAEIRRIADLSRAMIGDGPEETRIADLDLDRVFNRTPEEAALAAGISELSFDKKLELITLTYFGRGDASDEESEAGVARLRRIFERDTEDELVEKTVGKSPALAEYLDNALRIIGA